MWQQWIFRRPTIALSKTIGDEGPGVADHSTEALCARILARHRDRIRVQKSHIAIANLARIIKATLRLSNRQGFHATTLRNLAQASGLSMGALYSYFGSKEALLDMILSEVSTAATEALAEPPAEIRADPRQHLRWLIAAHIRLTEAMQPWFVFAYMEAKSFPADARKMAVDSEAATEQMFSDVLSKGVAEGHFQMPSIELTAALIKPLVQDWYIKRSKYRKRGISIEQYIASVSGLIEGAITQRVATSP